MGYTRLFAASAPHSGRGCIRRLIKQWAHLTNAEVQYEVGRRLGGLEGVDKWGAHCESCMGVGIKMLIITGCGIMFICSPGGFVQPRCWKQVASTGSSWMSGLTPGSVPPMFCYVGRRMLLLLDLGLGVTSRVALDIGIVCPQAAGHFGAAAGERLGAAEGYVRTECSRADMERRCRMGRIVFTL